MDYNKKGETPLLLGHGSDSLMSWCPGLNIYRVNRFNILTNDKPRKQITSKWITEEGYKKFDIIEELLLHNLVHIAEEIFAYVGFPYTWSCLRVNRLWYDFLANHLFPRWAEQLISQDPSLNDIYQAEELTSLNPGKICWQVHQLKEVWQSQRPKVKRLSCDSFVLSIKVHQDRHLYCGLNNGSLQLWDLQSASVGQRLHEHPDAHDKGVKSLDVTDEYIVTGSYDCTAKIWTKNALTQWNLLHVINLHNDSVWDLKLKGETLVTGGLDGAIGIFSLINQALTTRFFFKACDDLVAAVDFEENLLITGFEDSNIGLWSLNDARLLGRLHGHTSGITGIKINGILFASSSYDGTVRLWSIEGQPLAVFDEPNHLLRCIGFSGNTVIAGDFGGHLHQWKIDVNLARQQGPMVRIKHYSHFESHKSHIVCLQVSARRIVSGSRDKTVFVQDFWAPVASRRSI